MQKHRFLPIFLVLSGCTDSYTPEPDPGYGELGVGVFLLECAGQSDPACIAGGSEATSFPRAFAVGGRFGLRYDWRDSDDEHFGDPLPQIQSAAPQLLARSGEAFTAVVAGYAAVLAVTGDSEVVDIRHLYLAEVATLEVVPFDDPLVTPLLELNLEPGETLDVLVRPVDDDGVALSGRLDYTWSTSDLNAVDIPGAGGDSGRRKLAAFAPGKATITVTLGERTTEVLVTVGALDPTTGATTGDTTGATTGDTTGTDSSGTDGSSGDSSGDSTGSTGSTGGAL